MSGDRTFLGRGVRFPVSLSLSGGVSTSQLEDNVRQSIFIILGTAPGERVFRRYFGCRIHELMFAPNNTATCARAQVYCEDAITLFEPRVARVKAVARPNSDEPNRIDIRVEYIIAGQNRPRNLVYPFYLRNREDNPYDPTSGVSYR